MIEVIPNKNQIQIAKEESKKIGALNNSILKGDGNVYGVLGEILLSEYLGAKRVNTYDFDIVKLGKKIDVKTKQCTSQPKENYFCSIASFNIKQDCDIYAFVRILNDFSKAWILGALTKHEFYSQAKFYKKDDLDPSSDIGFRFRADCYNIEISKLKQFKIKNENSR